MVFDGIKPEILFLLQDNRFRDSKSFYDEHKEEIKQGMTVPMRQIASYFAELLVKVDDKVVTDPVKMVSRVRRDTRFSKDKHMYRDNMWIMFMRDKHKWQCYPCMWFEVSPGQFDIGITFFGNTPGLMKEYREFICKKQKLFKKAFCSVENSGMIMFDRMYKKLQEGSPAGLEKYYNQKDIGFMYSDNDLSALSGPEIIGIIEDKFNAMIPLYKLLLEISDSYFSKGDE